MTEICFLVAYLGVITTWIDLPTEPRYEGTVDLYVNLYKGND